MFDDSQLNNVSSAWSSETPGQHRGSQASEAPAGPYMGIRRSTTTITGTRQSVESGISSEVALKAVEHSHHRALLPTGGELPLVIIRRRRPSIQGPIYTPSTSGPPCESSSVSTSRCGGRILPTTSKVEHFLGAIQSSRTFIMCDALVWHS